MKLTLSESIKNSIIKKTPKHLRTAIVFILILITKINLAQNSKDSLYTGSVISIDVKLLEGFWQAEDSLGSIIEFVDSNSYELTLVSKKKDSYPYSFLKCGQYKVYSSGCYPMWPPVDCNLNLIDSNTLEIRLSQMGATLSITLYRRL